MSWWDALLGRVRLRRPKIEPLFALVTAQVTLADTLGWQPAGRAGICLKPVAAAAFRQVAEELRELLGLAADETGSRLTFPVDELGFQWVVVADPDFEDLVNLVHVAGQTLTEQGYGEQLLAAVFRFAVVEGGLAGGPGSPAGGEMGRRAYWIYAYKRGAFYPFVPVDEAAKRRDHAEEWRVAARMEREMPVEQEPGRWYALWGAPV